MDRHWHVFNYVPNIFWDTSGRSVDGSKGGFPRYTSASSFDGIYRGALGMEVVLSAPERHGWSSIAGSGGVEPVVPRPRELVPPR